MSMTSDLAHKEMVSPRCQDDSLGPVGRGFIIVLIGIIVGIIIALILITVMYYTRTFFFEYCSTQAPYCLMRDYEADPGRALSWGQSHDDIFEINDGTLYYLPPRIDRHCIHQRTPRVVIVNPQYCSFTINGVESQFRQSEHNEQIYYNGNHQVLTNGSCNVISASGGAIPEFGRPSKNWDRS